MSQPNYAYFESKIVPYSEARIGVMTHALNYGTGAFAGVRGYWNADRKQLFIFRPLDHFKRFLNSARILRSALTIQPEELVDITIQLLRKESYKEDCYIRPLYYKAEETIGVRLHDLRDEITIFAIPFTRYIPNDESAHVTFSSWRRVSDNAIPPRGKLTGAYVNSALIKSDAHYAGFDEALVLNEDGHISEGSAENFFMIRNGVLITPPVTDNILEGITRRSIMTLAREELGLEIVERSIDRTEVYICDEAFLTGTAVQLAAITQVDHRPIGSGEMGEATAQLRDLYDRALRGKLSSYEHWNQAVYVD
ncbi:MAG: branched-chain amino acid transaminase [Anaerolineales bacterium]|nr:branched-chain amino acid transaminase [Anaerolineales bacterium]